ncbi:HNH endonuclease signature motif containing protein [Blastococcus sp. TF02A_35]|uniref:HNH endonuclease signature motif containing protein n=1 Tax=Blastococcus sp. TF02A-35 TaxID=2559612 RepID=UPI001073F57C|nr:HNH endonuclease signature motif containing protein [Blastococcus sp. TF02A_35]TFV53296.1 HNH endonuclease [Blastococcus sp. TF02A_35]
MATAELARSRVEAALAGWLVERPPLVDRLPVGLLTAEEKATELRRLQALKAMDCAYEAELLMSLAAERPDTDDPPPGHPGARRRGSGSPVPGTSEFLPQELALVLNCSPVFAAGLLADSYALVERMPAVWEACSEGRLDWFRAQVFADVLGHASDEVVAAVVPLLLPEAAQLSSGRLRRRLVAAATAADEEFAEQRRVEAERRADVRTRPTADGMSALTSELPSPVAAAMWSAIDQAAQLARTTGDDRPIGVLRAEAHAALVLRPWDTSRPAMTGHVTVVAPLSALRPEGAAPDDERGPSVDGAPVTAGQVRELLARLGALGVQEPPGGSLAVAVTGADGALLASLTPAEVRRLAARGCPAHGRDAACGCALAGPPPAVSGHAPSAAQVRFLRLRDGTCRHPGCSRQAGRTDADHVVPYACGGRTSCDNLCCLCRTHHRLKTFARGWRFELLPDGTVRVTTPSGVTRTTRPPGSRDPVVQPALPGPDVAPVGPPPF